MTPPEPAPYRMLEVGGAEPPLACAEPDVRSGSRFCAGVGEGCLDGSGEEVSSGGALSDVGVGAVDGREVRPMQVSE